MALIVRLLGNGRTTAGGNTGLYTVSSPATAAIVNNLRFVDPSGTASSVSVFYKASGSSTPIRILDRDKSIAANASLVVKPELTMSLGDVLEATTAAGGPGLDFTVHGVEKL